MAGEQNYDKPTDSYERQSNSERLPETEQSFAPKEVEKRKERPLTPREKAIEFLMQSYPEILLIVISTFIAISSSSSAININTKIQEEITSLNRFYGQYLEDPRREEYEDLVTIFSIENKSPELEEFLSLGEKVHNDGVDYIYARDYLNLPSEKLQEMGEAFQNYISQITPRVNELYSILIQSETPGFTPVSGQESEIQSNILRKLALLGDSYNIFQAYGATPWSLGAYSAGIRQSMNEKEDLQNQLNQEMLKLLASSGGILLSILFHYREKLKGLVSFQRKRESGNRRARVRRTYGPQANDVSENTTDSSDYSLWTNEKLEEAAMLLRLELNEGDNNEQKIEELASIQEILKVRKG